SREPGGASARRQPRQEAEQPGGSVSPRSRLRQDRRRRQSPRRPDPGTQPQPANGRRRNGPADSDVAFTTTVRDMNIPLSFALGLSILMPVSAAAQIAPRPAPPADASNTAVAIAQVPKNYIIGTEDVLSVVFWGDKEMSAEVVVRPDGKISLPMLNDIAAVGMTPEDLAHNIER